MYRNIIEISRHQQETARTASLLHTRRSQLRLRTRELLTAVELFVTVAIGLCVLFCVRLTISML